MKFALRIVALGAFLLALAGPSSSLTYLKIWSFDPGVSSTYLGYYYCGGVDNVGDLNGDGINEVAAGSYNQRAVYVLSGSNGSRLATISGSVSYYGMCVSGGGDVDGDGTPDIAIGTYASSVFEVVSGKTFKVIHSVSGASYIGWSVAIIGDLDGDGCSEFVSSNSGGTSSSNVWVYDGSTGKVLYSLSRPPAPAGTTSVASWAPPGTSTRMGSPTSRPAPTRPILPPAEAARRAP
jgi:hypothetical protein